MVHKASNVGISINELFPKTSMLLSGAIEVGVYVACGGRTKEPPVHLSGHMWKIAI